MALSLVIGGGNIPGFPKHSEGTFTLNTDFLAKPSVQGKGQNLPFASQTFDEVIVEGLDYFQLDKVLFTEVRRVLIKPNGRISGYTGHGANLNEIKLALTQSDFVKITVYYGMGNPFGMSRVEFEAFKTTLRRVK
jgi:hypothetical protein